MARSEDPQRGPTKAQARAQAKQDKAARNASVQPAAVDMQCVNDKCTQHDVVTHAVPGVVLAANVLLTGTLSCTVCGNSLMVGGVDE